MFERLIETFLDHRNKKSSWGRWAGSVIIACILFNWTYVLVSSKSWVPMDLYTAMILISIYGLLSIKSVMETVRTKEVKQPMEKGAIIESLRNKGVDENIISELENRLKS